MPPNRTTSGLSKPQYTNKRESGPKCPVTGKRTQGIPHLRPTQYKRSRLSKNRRTINRAYGGVLSGSAVRERIIGAFLVEEQEIVKKVLEIQKAEEKQVSKSQSCLRQPKCLKVLLHNRNFVTEIMMLRETVING